MNKILEFKNVSFAYGRNTVLEDVNLDVEKGDFVGLAGPNGSGKTTLLKLALGLIRQNKGEILLFDRPSDKFNEWHKIGYVPQIIKFEHRFPVTVTEVVSQGRVARQGIGKRPGKEDRVAASAALEAVGMNGYKDGLITELSGGQRQRVFIARALAGQPELLILDEPTVGVDMESQERFFHFLADLKNQGLTLLLVSHDMEAISREVGKLIYLNKKVQYLGKPESFKDNMAQNPAEKKPLRHRH